MRFGPEKWMIPFLGEHILKILAPVYWTLVQYRESASVSLRVSIRRLEGSGMRDQRRRCRQGFANALGEVFSVPGSQCSLIDVRTPPEFLKWQVRVQDACVIEIAIAPAVQDMADIKLADPAR